MGFASMETQPSNFSKDLPQNNGFRSRFEGNPISWLRSNPFSMWTDQVQQSSLKKGLLCFPSIILDKKGIKKGLVRPIEHNDFYCTNMSDPALVPWAVKISNQLLSQEGTANKKYTGSGSPIIQKWTLTLAVWLITSNSYVTRVYFMISYHVCLEFMKTRILMKFPITLE